MTLIAAIPTPGFRPVDNNPLKDASKHQAGLFSILVISLINMLKRCIPPIPINPGHRIPFAVAGIVDQIIETAMGSQL